jgi:hypothetical protein
MSPRSPCVRPIFFGSSGWARLYCIKEMSFDLDLLDHLKTVRILVLRKGAR